MVINYLIINHFSIVPKQKFMTYDTSDRDKAHRKIISRETPRYKILLRRHINFIIGLELCDVIISVPCSSRV